VHQRGVTACPGLYFLGLPWLYTRGSSLPGWVNNDAEFIAQRIAALPPEPARRVPTKTAQ
jgi:putative flavoprotein involved in K+ transport